MRFGPSPSPSRWEDNAVNITDFTHSGLPSFGLLEACHVWNWHRPHCMSISIRNLTILSDGVWGVYPVSPVFGRTLSIVYLTSWLAGIFKHFGYITFGLIIVTAAIFGGYAIFLLGCLK